MLFSAARATPATTIVPAGSYLATRIRVPSDGHVVLHLTGLNVGGHAAFFMAPVRPSRFAGVGVASGDIAVLEAGMNGLGVRATPGVTAVDYEVRSLARGEYWLVALVGSDSIRLGEAYITLDVPNGDQMGSTTGPAREYTDTDFTTGGGLVAVTPYASTERVNGTVSFPVANRLFGAVFAEGQGPTVQCRGPRTTSCVWLGAPPGIYEATVTSAQGLRLTQAAETVGLVADVNLP